MCLRVCVLHSSFMSHQMWTFCQGLLHLSSGDWRLCPTAAYAGCTCTEGKVLWDLRYRCLRHLQTLTEVMS